MIYRINGQTSLGCFHLYTSQFQIIMTTSIYNNFVHCSILSENEGNRYWLDLKTILSS